MGGFCSDMKGVEVLLTVWSGFCPGFESDGPHGILTWFRPIRRF
jgi:hypothetical protein